MNQNDFSFGSRIIENFDLIPFPEIRQIYIETTSVISEILNRNPEVVFQGWFDLTNIVLEATKLYQNHLNSLQNNELIK